jgi:hypothetical protein
MYIFMYLREGDRERERRKREIELIELTPHDYGGRKVQNMQAGAPGKGQCYS